MSCFNSIDYFVKEIKYKEYKKNLDYEKDVKYMNECMKDNANCEDIKIFNNEGVYYPIWGEMQSGNIVIRQ